MDAKFLTETQRLLEMSLEGKSSLIIFEQLLADVINFTKAEFGFIGDVLHDGSVEPFIKVRAISNITSDVASKNPYRPEVMELSNPDTLLGRALKSEHFYLTNDPANAPFSVGLPYGHPTLTSFLGIPLKQGARTIGFLGLGNRDDGFDEGVVKDLDYYLTVTRHLIQSMQEKDGLSTTRLPLEKRQATMRDGHGEVMGVIGTGQGVTALRENESVLLKSAKLESLGQQARDIAHDFNNLLTIIRGNLRLLLDYDIVVKTDDLEDIINDALSAADKGAILNTQLSFFAKKQNLHANYVAVDKLLQDSLGLITKAIRGEAIIELNIASLTGGINIDRNLFENALINLAINAKNTLQDNGKIILSGKRKLITRDESDLFGNIEPGSYVVISMEDNGVGIPEENRKKIFEPFFSTKEPSFGSGLGLSMLHDFVTQSGGAVDIQSEIGKGTIVSLIFPAADDDEIIHEAALKPRELKIKHGEKKTVLVVEDEPRVRRFTCRTFRSFGFNVLEAEDANRAMQMLETHQQEIDLVFTDIVLPGNTNGRALAQHAIEKYPGLDVILTSGFDKVDVGSETQETRKLPIMKKPFSKEDLSIMLSNIMSR